MIREELDPDELAIIHALRAVRSNLNVKPFIVAGRAVNGQISFIFSNAPYLYNLDTIGKAWVTLIDAPEEHLQWFLPEARKALADRLLKGI